MRSIQCIPAIFFCIFVITANAAAQVIPFDSERWNIQAKESKVVDYLGQKSLYLKGGTAVLKDVEFTNGVIEFDIAFSAKRTFSGAMWRIQDEDNFEEFYLRPHQSGNPDANQYQPVFNGIAAWQLLYGERYSAPVKYDFDQWMPVKIVVSGENAEVYIKDMATPALSIGKLLREIKPGGVGVNVGNFAYSYFANFRVTPMNDPPQLKGKALPPETVPAGTVMTWMVSNTIDGKTLDSKYQLTPADKNALNFKQLAAEDNGTANLSRIQGPGKDKNTAFAKLTIRSDIEQIKKVKFGFSDSVRVYFNDRLIYGGSDIYESRDYRFLGTIGLFDELYLPLKKGDNELWFAVTENFGGWGIKAMFEDMSGIRIKE
ncbi:MAG: hypothetical protein KDB79_07400 [Acidobacteria bacterium]|nr:hypothetical protein [Acidobacteriota bacterium]